MNAVCVSATLEKARGSVNQDSCCAIRNQRGLNVFAVADGLGSHVHSEIASRAAIAAVIDSPPDWDVGEPDLLTRVASVQRSVSEEARRFCAQSGVNMPESNAFSTTIILGVETPNAVHFAWLGNGAILHVHGSALLTARGRGVPWQTTNLLTPHVEGSIEGKPALTKYLSGVRSSEPYRPSRLAVALDETGLGDIFVICSDGILSAEERIVGHPPDGSSWLRLEPKYLLLFDLLAEITDLPGDVTEDGIEQRAEVYLHTLRANGWQHDDTTLAIFFSRQFLQARRAAQQRRTQPNEPIS